MLPNIGQLRVPGTYFGNPVSKVEETNTRFEVGHV